MPSLFQAETRDAFYRRFERLRPDAPPRFGQLSAPAMVSHLIDTLRLTLGELPAEPVVSAFRLPGVKHAVIGFLPWPKGRIVGPSEAFSSTPGAWERDLALHRELLERFAQCVTRDEWPPHPMFGAMSRRQWDRFTYRHLDHHLGQFGV